MTATTQEAQCQHRRYSLDVQEQTGICIDCGAEGRMQFVVPTPARVEAVGWMPIETAPKDGTELLLVDAEGVRVVGLWSKHNHVPLYGWVRRIELYGEEVDGFGAVGWMPLPPAPLSGDAHV